MFKKVLKNRVQSKIITNLSIILVVTTMVKEYRKVARRLSIHRRHEALSSLEQVKCRCLLKLFHLCAGAARKKANDNKKRHKLKRIANYYLMRRLEILTQSFEESTITERKYLGFNDFSTDECRNYFRCAKPHLNRIKACLRIPGKIKFKNRTTMSGEELLCRALYEICSGIDQYKISKLFGGDQPLQSRAYSWFCLHVYDNFSHLVHNNLKWWLDSGLLEESNEAIKRKMKWSEWCDDEMDIAMFIDCNCMPSSRPGGGPCEDGASARRWSEKFQRSFYNGWKSIHGLKHQKTAILHSMDVKVLITLI